MSEKEEHSVTGQRKLNGRTRLVKVLVVLISIVVIAAVVVIAKQALSGAEISGRAISEGKTSKSQTKQAASGSLDGPAIAKSDFVKDLPKSAVIELKIGEEHYTVSKSSVTLGRPENPDITLTLPTKYSTELSKDLCGAVKQANQNRDLGVEIHTSQTALMWKYRGMLKYKDCLG